MGPTAPPGQSETRLRPWLDRWLLERSTNGELLKTWCSRLLSAKFSGHVYCKYCKKNIAFSTKGLKALTNHANTIKHVSNGKLFHLNVLKTQGTNGNGPKKKTPQSKVSSNITTSTKTIKPSTVIKTGRKRRDNPKAVSKGSRFIPTRKLISVSSARGKTIPRPSTSTPSTTSSFHQKFSVPVLSKEFLQFKKCALQDQAAAPGPSKRRRPTTTLGPTTAGKKAVLSLRDLSKTLSSVSKSVVSQCLPSGWRRRPVITSPPPSSSSSPSSRSSSPFVQLQAKKQASPQTTRTLLFPLPQTRGDGEPSRRSPIPAVSVSTRGRLPLSHAHSQQIYHGANLRALGASPHLHTDWQNRTTFIPVFVCYFCHEDFPSKSSLYEHHEQCTMKLSAQPHTSGTKASSVATVGSVGKDCVRVVIPATWDPRDQMSKTPTKPSPLTRPPLVSSFPSVSTSNTLSSSYPFYSTHTLSVSQPEFLSGLGLLPIKTALQQQKKISRKRRNTECESLDWEEDDFTPKTPCTPPTPKLLISHLSREEHKQQHDLPILHRIFHLSSIDNSTLKRDTTDKESSDKDFTVSQTMNSSSSTSSASAGKDVDPHGKPQVRWDGKISVARSLYNVDVTSPLGQFVVKHYRGDPSLHILSDIESHCRTTAATASPKTCLRTRTQPHPVTFYNNGRRALFEDCSHQYKFNRWQVKEFIRRVNTGLDRNSRQLLQQMKKCQVWIRRLSKSDLKQWVSKQHDITVNLKPLSVAEIAYWTKPKPTVQSSTLFNDDHRAVSIFPSGLHFSSPSVKRVLGLKSKREVRIKTVDALHPNVLNIANYVSEETCVDLLKNCKTIYRCLLSDSSKNDCENMNISPLQTFSSSSSSSTFLSSSSSSSSSSLSNPILRRMLTHRLMCSGDYTCGNTLPDITNLDMGSRESGSGRTVSDKLIHPFKSVSASLKMRESVSRMGHSDRLVKAFSISQMVCQNLEDGYCVGKDRTTDTVSNSPSVENFEILYKEEPAEVVEAVSCDSFIDPKPSDLPRAEIPSDAQTLSDTVEPERSGADKGCVMAIPAFTTKTATTCKSSRPAKGACVSQGPKQPKLSGVSEICLTSMGSEECQDILSVEDYPQLMTPFLNHFKLLTSQRATVSLQAHSNSDRSTSGSRLGLAAATSTSGRRKINPAASVAGIPTWQVGKSVTKGSVDEEEECVRQQKTRVGARSGDGEWEPEAGAGNDRARQIKRQDSGRRSRRKSSPRVTTRIRVGLKRRLSAAGLVKREEPLPSSPLVDTTVVFGPVLAQS